MGTALGRRSWGRGWGAEQQVWAGAGMGGTDGWWGLAAAGAALSTVGWAEPSLGDGFGALSAAIPHPASPQPHWP